MNTRQTRRQATSTPITPATRTPQEELERVDRELLSLQQARNALQQQAQESTTGSFPDQRQESETTIAVPAESLARIITDARNEDRSLPKFYGDVLDWPIFREKFRDTTNKFKISDDSNMTRLEKALRGKARDRVKDMLKNPCFVNEIMEVLETRYGGASNVSAAAMEAVENLRPLRSDLHNLTEFTLHVSKVHRMYKLAGIHHLQQGTIKRILMLMPLTQRQLWDMRNSSVADNLEGFVSWLLHSIDACQVDSLMRDSHSDPRPAKRTISHRDEGHRRYERNHPYRDYRRTYNRDAEAGNSRWNNHDRRGDRYERTFVKEERHDNPRGSFAYARRSPQNTSGRRTSPTPRVLQQAVTAKNSRACVVGCAAAHDFSDCPRFKDGTQQERFRLIREHKRCPFCCGSHRLSNCPEKQ